MLSWGAVHSSVRLAFLLLFEEFVLLLRLLLPAVVLVALAFVAEGVAMQKCVFRSSSRVWAWCVIVCLRFDMLARGYPCCFLGFGFVLAFALFRCLCWMHS